MPSKHPGSHKTRVDTLEDSVAQPACGYCGAPCERRYCDVECYRAKQRSQQPEIRFWAKVNKTDGCWLWTASRSGGRKREQYGQFVVTVAPNMVRRIGAHVWAYEQANGPVPSGLEIMHLCHNRLCVRPDHLSVGTRSENVRASVAEGHYHVPHKPKKLSDEQVLELRKLAAVGVPYIRLAEHFGISKALAGRIAKGLARPYVGARKAS